MVMRETTRRGLSAAVAISLSLGLAMGCNAVLGSLHDRSGGPDAGPDAGGTTWNSLTDSTEWRTLDTTTIHPGAANYSGARFDGRYMYFPPQISLATRYDTNGDFADAGSWSFFDTTGVDQNAQGFAGAEFDGRYLYLVPWNNGSFDGVVARYDSMGPFTSAGSWSTFDTSTVAAAAVGFSGSGFDGRYLYLVPMAGASADGGTASADGGTVYDFVQYDTTAQFTSPQSWRIFDSTALGATGFVGSVFDGHYLYFPGFPIARYDTTQRFVATTSWTTFDPDVLSVGQSSISQTGFDGRYVYFAGLVEIQYDTTKPFADAKSWAVFDVSTLKAGARGFGTVAFDGRYVYFVPLFNGTGLDGGYVYDGILARYDTTLGFTDTAAWSTFDLTTLSSGAVGFGSAAFDGQYVYLVPGWESTFARFGAREPPSMPHLCSNASALYCFGGSFF
jgi:hypothetical protein